MRLTTRRPKGPDGGQLAGLLLAWLALVLTFCLIAEVCGTLMDDASRVRALLDRCKGDPSRFNAVVLGRGPYWSRQREIAASVVRFPETLVPTGNGVGKTYLDAGILHWFLISHPGSIVLATAPSQTQLEEVLWKEVERAYHNSRIPLGGRLLRDPLKVELGPDWKALAYSTNKVERLSGHHGEHLLAIVDEASGVDPAVNEAIDSCNPSRQLLTGNPLHSSGAFYERCSKALARQDDPDRLTNLITIPSTESPDIALPRSPRGLADATWLAKSRADYGEGSLWWLPHVLARFPDASEEQVIPRSWLDRAGAAVHVRSGPTRTAIDIGTGCGGDRSTVMTRDDNGVLAFEWSNTWSMEVLATRAAMQVQRYRVEPHRVTWDAAGVGADFANRLAAVDIHGARPFVGGASGGKSKRYANLRAAVAWLARQRLDPGRMAEPGSPVAHAQVSFAIRPDWLAAGLREELEGLRYQLTNSGAIALEKAEDWAARLRRSPDLAVTFLQSFAYPEHLAI